MLFYRRKIYDFFSLVEFGFNFGRIFGILVRVLVIKFYNRSHQEKMEKTEMEFSHQGEKITAIYPFFGPADSKTLLSIIKLEKYSAPAFPELTSFVHHYFSGEGKHSEEITEIMNTKYFVGFTGILYLPQEKEVYFMDHPKFDMASVVDTDNLISRIRLNDFRTRVSLDGIETGTLPWNKIAKNPFFIAVSGGEEGAEKLAELASKHQTKNGHIFVPKISNFMSPQARIPLLYSYDRGRSLTVSLNGSGSTTNSYTFGLIKNQ